MKQFGDRRFVAAVGEFISHHGSGAAVPKENGARAGLVFDIACRQ